MAVTYEPHVAVIGSGSWGTTLALLLARKGLVVRMWVRTPEEAATLKAERQNRRFLPDHIFPSSLQITSELEETLSQGCQLVLFSVPSDKMRLSVQQTRPYYEALKQPPPV